MNGILKKILILIFLKIRQLKALWEYAGITYYALLNINFIATRQLKDIALNKPEIRLSETKPQFLRKTTVYTHQKSLHCDINKVYFWLEQMKSSFFRENNDAQIKSSVPPWNIFRLRFIPNTIGLSKVLREFNEDSHKILQ